MKGLMGGWRQGVIRFALGAFIACNFAMAGFFIGTTHAAVEAAVKGADISVGKGIGFLAAALAVSIGVLGAGIAVAGCGSAAIGATAEKPENFGKYMVFVGLAEGVAIYGLIIAIMILRAL